MPYDKRDEKSGRFTPEFADEDFLDALREQDGATTSGVADAVGCKYRTAYARLNKLEDAELVMSREIGNSLLWELADDYGNTAPRDGQQSTESTSNVQRDPTVGADVDRDESPGASTIDDVLEGWPPAGQSKREQRRQAGRAALEWLRDVGEATARDFCEHVEPDHPVDGQSAKTWWRKTVHPPLKRAQDAGLVGFTEGSKVYTWTGDGE